MTDANLGQIAEISALQLKHSRFSAIKVAVEHTFTRITAISTMQCNRNSCICASRTTISSDNFHFIDLHWYKIRAVFGRRRQFTNHAIFLIQPFAIIQKVIVFSLAVAATRVVAHNDFVEQPTGAETFVVVPHTNLFNFSQCNAFEIEFVNTTTFKVLQRVLQQLFARRAIFTTQFNINIGTCSCSQSISSMNIQCITNQWRTCLTIAV
mmetsp:Transcript_5097/g.8322  ORF Transcript_5097/g.8322 Transcript_5097/m.8322 type:complete len:209 (+) Transcript_5097:2305-2931(+)